jgi:hypothetical protein
MLAAEVRQGGEEDLDGEGFDGGDADGAFEAGVAAGDAAGDGEGLALDALDIAEDGLAGGGEDVAAGGFLEQAGAGGGLEGGEAAAERLPWRAMARKAVSRSQSGVGVGMGGGTPVRFCTSMLRG